MAKECVGQCVPCADLKSGNPFTRKMRIGSDRRGAIMLRTIAKNSGRAPRFTLKLRLDDGLKKNTVKAIADGPIGGSISAGTRFFGITQTPKIKRKYWP